MSEWRTSSWTYHDIYLLLDLREHGLIGHGNAFEDMMCGAVDRLCGAHEIDMGEATYPAKRLSDMDGDPMSATRIPWLR